MKKIISQHDKDLCLAIFILTIGVLGCILDFYNGEYDIMPQLDFLDFLDEQNYKNEIDKPALYPIMNSYYVMSSVWFIFIIFGILIFCVELYEYKTPILLSAIPCLLLLIIKIKWLEGKIELYKYLIT